MWNLIFVRLEMVLVSVQDRCMVYVKRTMVQKLFWMHLMVLLGDVGHVESCFDLFGDSVSVGAK